MTHRIYLRLPGQKVENNTTTEDEAVAAFAFRRLLDQTHRVGAGVAAVWTIDKQQLAYFKYPAGYDPDSVYSEVMARKPAETPPAG